MNGATKSMLVLPLAALLCVILMFHWCGTEKIPAPVGGPSALVVRGPLEVRLVEEGHLQARRSETYSSAISDRRVRISFLVEEGTLVDKEDLLIKFDASEFQVEATRLEMRLQELRAEGEKAQDDLEILALEKKRRLAEQKDEIRLAELALHHLSQGSGPLKIRELEAANDAAARRLAQLRADYADLEPLLEKGFITAGGLERVASAAATAEEELEIAGIKLSTYREFTLPGEMEKFRVRLKNLREELASMGESDTVREQRLRERLSRLEDSKQQTHSRLEEVWRSMEAAEQRATSPGIVIYQKISDPVMGARKVQVGDEVFSNQPLITLPDVSSMNAEFRVRETDIHHLRVGQPVRIAVRAYPDLVLDGEVSLVGTLARENRTEDVEKHFQVTSRVAHSDERLRPGMTVRVETVVQSEEDALQVPLTAVFHHEGRSFCYTQSRPERWEDRAVVTGLAGTDHIQVLQGLDEGERVALFLPSGR